MKKVLLALLTLSLAVSGVEAGETPRDTVSLDEVVVTAPLKTDPDLIPLNVTQITEAEITKSSESSLLPVLVAKVPGLFVTERGFEGYGVSGAAANSGQVYIRGVGDGNKVLFMIDGQPQWAGIFGHSLSDTYVANGIERVEVIKGPSSLLYGSNAMGGSVNLITKSQKHDGLTGRARAMFGSFTTQKFSLSTGYKKGKFSATLSGQLDRSNGNRERSSFWLANEFAQLKYAISSNWSVAGMLDMTQSFSNYPGSVQLPRENTWSDIFRGTGGIYVKNAYDKMDGGVQGYINWGNHKIDDGNIIEKEPPTDYLFNSNDYNMGFTVYESFYLWKLNTISAGVDFQHWGGHMWNTDKIDPSQRSSEEKHKVNEIAGYVMMQQGFFNDILNVNGGVRLQHGSSYGNIWVPQAGFIVKPGRDAQIKASFSKGFTAPNIRQLYLYPPKNPNLKPEYMLNYEVSYKQYLL
ncbi:MAG: TonB-dependent receptor, partial [Muribaculaceae bacterium]|nr:TonB-dependent receptor [Muribaculaceae bacterium]